MKNLDLFVKNFSVGLSKLSSSTVRGIFWSRIAFCKKLHHFRTLSKTLSIFCQNHFGRIVIPAIYITSGAFVWKELLSQNLCSFVIFQNREGNLWISVEQISAWISKLHFSFLERAAWGRKIYIPKKISDPCDTMNEEIHHFGINFWHGCQILFLRVRTIFLRKTYTLKILDWVSFVRSFWWTSLNSVPKIFGAGYHEFFLHFFLFSDIEQKNFCFLAKILRQFIQNSILCVRRIISSEILGLKN